MNQEVATLSSTELAEIDAEIAAEAKSLQDTLSVSGNKLSIKDKQFTTPDGQTFNGPFDVIVLDWSSQNQYYEGAYDPNNIKAPDCFAIGKDPKTLVPDVGIAKPQNGACEGCPQDVWGSGSGKGKACKNTRQVIVRRPGSPDLMTLSLPPTSIKAFDAAMKSILATQRQAVQFIIPINFHPDMSYSQIIWGEAQPNPEYATDYMTKKNGTTAELLAIKPQ